MNPESPCVDAFAISVRGLCKSLGMKFALGPLTLNIRQGAICALVGPNGAGKTTLMSLLMGLRQADAGSARVLGYDVAESEVDVKRHVAYVSPDVSYSAWETVGRTIDFISGFYPDWSDERCARLLGSFGLRRSEHVDALSFGSRVKLAILLALSRDPRLLLLDEPAAGLDTVARQQLFGELLHFMRDERRTIVISSHQLSEVERLADHVAVMQAGQVIACGAIPDLLERYRQLDIELPDDSARHGMPERLQILAQDRRRARVLLDTASSQRQVLARLGIEVISESALTLEELVVALTKTGTARWQPKFA